MNAMLISHFYNEEFLLPFWVKHHLKLFEHAVLVNHASTDRSVEIIKDLAPHWKIQDTRLKDFNAWSNDLEIMDIEYEIDQQHPGCWKLVLNTTEFLMTTDIAGYLTAHHSNDKAIAMDSVVMVDRPSERYDKVYNDKQLYYQKYYGYVDRSHRTRRYRFIHRMPDGNYHVGRHGTNHDYVFDSELLLAWFGWSPFEYIKARKLQIQTRIPESDRRRLMGREHIQTPETLELAYQEQAKSIYNLFLDETYRRNLEFLRDQGF